MNEKNLRTPTSSEAREYGRKGGLTKAANARRRKEHQEQWLALLETKDEDGLTIREKLDRALAVKASEGDVNAYEKIMEYSGLSVRLELQEEDRRIKRDELKLKEKQADLTKQDAAEDTAAADAWTNVLGQIRGVMEQDEDSTGS